MRLRHKVPIGVALVALLFIVLWLAFHAGAPRQGISVTFTTIPGHFPEPGRVYADHVIVAWVTNTGRSAIDLGSAYVQFEDKAGEIVSDLGSTWNQQGSSLPLPPGRAAWLANGFDQNRKRLKFTFEYHRKGGPLVRSVSKGSNMLPLSRLPKRTYDWLRQNGIVDGTLHGRYESPWIENPKLTAAKQSSRSAEVRASGPTAQTNR